MRIIPLARIPHQELNVVLDGQNCTIVLRHLQTRLYLDLTVNRVVIARGLVCNNRANILQRPVRGFAGTLHFWDTEGDTPPAFEKLGERYFLVFIHKDEPMPAKLVY